MNAEQRHRGMETNLFGEPVLGFRLNASASWLDPVMTKTSGGTYDGKQAVGVPRDNYTLGAEYDIKPLEGLTATALLTHSGSQWADAVNSKKPTAIPRWIPDCVTAPDSTRMILCGASGAKT